MAETCPTCLRPFRDQGEQQDDGIHCPASPRDHRLVRDDLACAHIGIEARDRQLAAGVRALKVANDLLGRSRDLLADTEAKLTAVIELLDQEAHGG